jgi:hypothetical protein
VTTLLLFVVAGGLLAAGSGTVLLALCRGAAHSDQPGPEPSDPVRQAAEQAGLIPRQGASS